MKMGAAVNAFPAIHPYGNARVLPGGPLDSLIPVARDQADLHRKIIEVGHEQLVLRSKAPLLRFMPLRLPGNAMVPYTLGGVNIPSALSSPFELWRRDPSNS